MGVTVASGEVVVPELARLILGPKAEMIWPSSGDPLRRWALLFEEWLDEREANGGKARRGEARNAWRQFLEFTGRPPWEARCEDVRAWTGQQERQAFSSSTIYFRTQMLKKFFAFCQERGVEAAEGGNPAAEAGYRNVRKTERSEMLSAEEARALLRVLEQDGSIQGKRDYALLLAMLTTGLETGRLRTLRWGDLTPDREGAWVRRPCQAPIQIPMGVWTAIWDWLEASGRLESMAAEDVVFAAQVNPLTVIPSGKAEEWRSKQAMTHKNLIVLVKQYAAQAGLDAVRVTCDSLRYTALALRLEAGDSREQLMAFLGSTNASTVRKRVDRLVKRVKRPLWVKGEPGERALEPIDHTPRRIQPGEQLSLKHGFYARVLPGEELEEAQTVGADDLKGEIVAARVVLRRLLALAYEAERLEEMAHLVELWGRCADRLANLMRTQRAVRPPKEENDRRFAAVLDTMWEEGPES